MVTTPSAWVSNVPIACHTKWFFDTLYVFQGPTTLSCTARGVSPDAEITGNGSCMPSYVLHRTAGARCGTYTEEQSRLDHQDGLYMIRLRARSPAQRSPDNDPCHCILSAHPPLMERRSPTLGVLRAVVKSKARAHHLLLPLITRVGGIMSWRLRRGVLLPQHSSKPSGQIPTFPGWDFPFSGPLSHFRYNHHTAPNLPSDRSGVLPIPLSSNTNLALSL